MPAQPLKIMVASSVYHFEDQIERVAAILTSYGYDVINSHLGTVRVGPHRNNFEACRQAVEGCDIFLGIIRGQYGSGLGAPRGLADAEVSITHAELRHAVQLDKPRLFLVELNVNVARQLFKSLRKPLAGELFDDKQQQVWPPQDQKQRDRLKDNPFRDNEIISDLRVLDMYDEALRTGTPLSQRQDHWCQTYRSLTEMERFLETQFRDQKQLRVELNAVRQLGP